MKRIFIDIETTGIPYPQSGLIQLAGIIEVDGKEAEAFSFNARPFPTDVISDEALQVNGRARAEIGAYEAPSEVFAKFVRLLDGHVDRYNRTDKFHFIAYNAIFDSEHLRAWFEKNNDRFFGSWFWHPPIDVMGMAAVKLMGSRHELPNFKLLTVAKALGLDVDEGNAHEAMYDVELARKLFKVLLANPA